MRIHRPFAFLVLSIGLNFTACVHAADKINEQQSFSDVYSLYITANNQENKQDALTYAKQALTLGIERFGETSENTTNLKYNLALSLVANSNLDAAFDMFSEVITDYGTLFGEHSEAQYRAMLEQVHTLAEYSQSDVKNVTGRYKRAIKKTQDTAEHIIERNPNNAAAIYYELARAFNSTPLHGLLFSRAYDINEQAEEYLLLQVGEEDLRTLEIRFMLAKYASAKNKKNTAIEYYEQVVSTVASAIDTSHPYELASHASLVDLYERKGQSDKATEHCLAIGRMKPWNDDIDPIPLYRKDPKYPVSMARRSRDGSVELEFVISSFGFVENISVLTSTHDDFTKSAIEALEKWRYAPKIIEGQAVKSENQKVRLDFTIG